MNNDENDIVYRLNKRASIRRQIASRKSVQENKPDRISDLLEEAANVISTMRGDTPPIKYERHDASWVSVDPSMWATILEKVDLVGVAVKADASFHCYNCTYIVGDDLYDITYENGCEYPLSIETKRAKLS